MQLLTTLAAVSAAGLIVGNAAVAAQQGAQPATAKAPAAQSQKADQKADLYPAHFPAIKPDKNDKKDKTVSVKPGDSLAKIAKANDSTWQRLYDKNTKIDDPDEIFPGDKLTVPTSDEKLAKRPLPAAASPATSAATTSSLSQSDAETVATTRPAPASAPAVPTGSVWDRIAACESGGNWSISTGNGFYGGLQFTISSWNAVGGSGLPSNASRAEQIMRAEKLQAMQGWGAWPVCSVKAGV